MTNAQAPMINAIMNWSFSRCRHDFLRGVGQVFRIDYLDAAFGEDLATFLHFGPFETNDERDAEADGFAGADDGVGDRRAAGDSAEDVYEDRFHVRIGEDDAEGLGDLGLVRPAADVEEV